MAAEVTEDLNKAQKRELKWERKQAKVKAAAEAAGQTYVAPSKEGKDNVTDKIGKRKKRKLAALQLDIGADALAPSSQKADIKPKKSKQQPDVLANGTTPGHAEGAADHSNAEKKTAKQAKKAAREVAATAAEPAAADGAADPAKPKKKKKKTVMQPEAAQPSEPQAASAAPVKKQKKATASDTPAPHGRVQAHQEAVLASVGDQELAKSGKSIRKGLYQEHPSVSGMSVEEVAKHRADRDTAVTGVDLRPVLQFDQAGKIQRVLFVHCHDHGLLLTCRGLAAFRSSIASACTYHENRCVATFTCSFPVGCHSLCIC